MTKNIKTFVDKLLSNHYLSHWIIMSVDLLNSIVCTFVALGITRLLVGYIPVTVIGYITLLSLVASALSFGILRTDRSIIRHSSVKSLWKLIMASLIKLIIMAVFIYLQGSWLKNNQIKIYLIIDLMATTLSLIIIRVAMLIVYDIFVARVGKSKLKVLVYGAGQNSVALSILLSQSKQYRLAGFYNYGKDLKSYRISELPVYHFCDQLDFDKLHEKLKFDAVLFPSIKAAKNERDRLMGYCVKRGVKTLITPPITDVTDDSLYNTQVREVRIEDVLGRDEIDINMQEVIASFYGKSVMVTGAVGSIGSELCRNLAAIKVKHLILFDNAETPMHELRLELEKNFPELKFTPFIGDVRFKERLDFAFRQFQPQVVFHAAAYKHVPLMEDNPCEAIRVNAEGTRYVADLCVEHGVEKMIMISTDKAVNPTNIMGASKRLAEIYVQSLGVAIESGEIKGVTKFVTTRFGNVLGSNGSVIPLFRKQIEQGGPVTVTHPEITRYFMTIPEACRLVLEAATMSDGNNIYVFDMGEPIKIATLAHQMIYLAGFNPETDIKIEFTGLRSGEKLYEEVLSDEENTILTQNKKIRIAKVREYQYCDVVRHFDDLKQLACAVSTEQAVRLMKEIIPEFQSKNSKFEKLDVEIMSKSVASVD